MNIRVSRRTLRWIKRIALGLVVIVVATAGLYVLGRSITPRTATGRPILFSPAVRAAETYRAQVEAWAVQFDQLSGELANLLDTGGDLYEQSIRANAALEQALRLAQETELTSSPVALAELRQMARQAGRDYVSAAQAVAALINAPTQARLVAAVQLIDQAQNALVVVERSRWLMAPESAK